MRDPALLDQVARACRETLGLSPKKRVLVAVSAGADSTALASLLHALADAGLPLDLHLGHVDHGWRGAAAAAEDAEAVRALACRLGRPLSISEAPTPPLPHTEEAARRWRYRCLARMAHAAGCSVVATGHHAGDQAETLLMRLLRGSGHVGLAGIPAVRSLEPGGLTVVRPLLGIEPRALRAWLRGQDLTWVEDPTNADLSRDRATIRARLARHGRSERAAVPLLADLARRLRKRLTRREARIRRKLETRQRSYPDAQALALDRAWLASLPGEDLGLALREAGTALHAEAQGPWFTRRHRDLMARLLRTGGALDLPHNLVFHVSGRRAWLARRELVVHPLPALAMHIVPIGRFDLAAFLAAGGAAPGARRAALDADRLGADRLGADRLGADRLGTAPRLRRLQGVDRFRPFGSGASHDVGISAWMSRQGRPHWVRRGQLVVRGARGVAWLVGERIDAGHAVGPTTRRVAILEVACPPAARPGSPVPERTST